MRVVMLCSSLYSETACATAVRLAYAGFVPAGALSLSTLDGATLLRKVRQWGFQNAVRHARTKVIPQSSHGRQLLQNPELLPYLQGKSGTFRSLREVASFYNFPVSVTKNHNSADAIAQLTEWSPDLIAFTGGNILRKPVLCIPRLGVLNVHLGLLPDVRGMSTPEWSLLSRIPVGITIHFMDEGIDTGPVLQRYEYFRPSACESLTDLRNCLIAFGVEKLGGAVSALDSGSIAAQPQSNTENDNQFFVMHDWLKERAANRLIQSRSTHGVGA